MTFNEVLLTGLFVGLVVALLAVSVSLIILWGRHAECEAAFNAQVALTDNAHRSARATQRDFRTLHAHAHKLKQQLDAARLANMHAENVAEEPTAALTLVGER